MNYYLGLDLSPDALRAVVVDDHLDIITADSVQFPKHDDPSSSSSSPNPSSTLSLAHILTALDALFAKLSARTNLAHVKSITGAVFPSVVFYTHNNNNTPTSNVDLVSLWSGSLAVSSMPTPTDTTLAPFAQLLQDSCYGSASRMAERCGTSSLAGPFSGLLAAHLLQLRLSSPDTWSNLSAASSLAAFLPAVLSGTTNPAVVTVADGLSYGLLDYSSLSAGTPDWDWDGIRFVAGVENNGGDKEEEQVRKVSSLLGRVAYSAPTTVISRYFVDKYGFDKETSIHTFTSTHLATYLSLVPTTSDAVLSFGPQDAMIFSSPSPSSSSSPPTPQTLIQSFPHPAPPPQQQDSSHQWISILASRNGDVTRTLVRDMYTKSWSAFDRLVAIVPPGGSIGLDDKLFSFWFLQPESESCYLHSSTNNHNNASSSPRGIFRFENGTKVPEFRDLRANPRCLVEGQIMAFRMRFGRVVSSSSTSNTSPNGSLPNGHTTTNGNHPNTTFSTSFTPSNPSLPFNPYISTHDFLPRRIFATGTASYFPSIVNVVGEVFNAPVFVSQSVLEEGVVWAGMMTALQQAGQGGAAGAGAGVGNGGGGEEERNGGESAVNGIGGGGGDNAVAAAEAEVLAGVLARIPSRAAIGAAYMARWNWKRSPLLSNSARAGTGGGRSGGSGSSSPGAGTSFEDDVRLLLAKRWVQQQSQQSQSQSQSPHPQQQQQQQHAGSVGLGFGHYQPQHQQNPLSPAPPATLPNQNALSPLSALSLTTALPPSLISSTSSPLFGHHLQTPTSAVTPSSAGLLSPFHTHTHHSSQSGGASTGGGGGGGGGRPGRLLQRAKSALALPSETVVEVDEDEEEEGEGENGEEKEEEEVQIQVQGGGVGGGGDVPPRDSGVYKYPLVSGNITVSGSGAVTGGSGGGGGGGSTIPLFTPISQTPPPLPSASSLQQPIHPPPSLTLTTSTTTTTSLTTTGAGMGAGGGPGPLTALIGPAPSPAPLTSTLHPISALTTNDADAQFGLVKVAEPDEDGFVCYAAMVAEWVRLEKGVWGGLW